MDAAFTQTLLQQMPKPSGNVECKDGEVDGVKYRLYWPKGATSELPTAIWAHGGGLMFGDIDTDDYMCRAVAEHTNSAVISTEYRLAPEHKWPSQLEDCMTVYKWAHENASSFHGDPNRFYTIGGSAGGLLALAMANQVVQDSQLKPGLKGIAAMVPVTCHYDNVPEKYKSMYKAHTDNAKGTPIIDGEAVKFMCGHIAADPKDSSLFTILSDNHKDFPPTYFTSCEYDPLRDDAYMMEAALKEAGVQTKLDYYEGFPHYFWIFPSVPESQVYMDNMFAGIMWLHSQM
ncbi:hypothetical protein LTR08_003584 [Meristemomyces frigidus]|nr:hypothetical protein LTR08_003584 [Meristemomyces frigidus]